MYAPRDCIGKNFAQLEMRLILLNIMKTYHFILDDKQNKEIFNNENYMSYISYIDSRGWLILEYYLEWFQGKGYYELPEYAEEEIRMSESHINKYIGTMSQYHARLKKSNVNLSAKLKKYISINKNFKILSCSPERFIKIDSNKMVETRPIKGSQKRDPNQEKDMILANKLVFKIFINI